MILRGAEKILIYITHTNAIKHICLLLYWNYAIWFWSYANLITCKIISLKKKAINFHSPILFSVLILCFTPSSQFSIVYLLLSRSSICHNLFYFFFLQNFWYFHVTDGSSRWNKSCRVYVLLSLQRNQSQEWYSLVESSVSNPLFSVRGITSTRKC